MPVHRFKDNFFDYYVEFVNNNKRDGNRDLEGGLNQFRFFIKKQFLSPHDITENLCLRFRTFLLDKLTDKSPSDYFGAFKRVIKSTTKEGYFRFNPSEDIRSKTNASKKIRPRHIIGISKKYWFKAVAEEISYINGNYLFVCHQKIS